MAKLNAARRNALPKTSFVFPGKRAYPIHTRQHGIAALGRVRQHGTPAQQNAVRSADCRRYPGLPACKR